MTDNDVQTRFTNLKTWPPNGALYPAVWRDKTNVLHWAVGAKIHRDTRIMWTWCGEKDIPANAAWLQRTEDKVTCKGCLQAHHIEEEDQREAKLADNQFGVGA